METLNKEFESLLNIKDKEIEEQALHIKSLTSTHQRDLETLHTAHNEKVTQLEAQHTKDLEQKFEELKSKTMEIKWLESEVEGYEVRSCLCSSAEGCLFQLLCFACFVLCALLMRRFRAKKYICHGY